MKSEQFLANEAEVLVRFMAGDHSAFEQLYNHYNSHALKIVYKFLSDSFETEDIVQRSWEKMYRYKNRLDVTRPFWPFFYVLFRRQMKDYVRDDVTRKKYIAFYDFSNDYQFADNETPEELVIAYETLKEHKQLPPKSKTQNGHGLNMYKNHGCRCDFCRAANTNCNRRYYLRVGWKAQKPKRGKVPVTQR